MPHTPSRCAYWSPAWAQRHPRKSSLLGREARRLPGYKLHAVALLHPHAMEPLLQRDVLTPGGHVDLGDAGNSSETSVGTHLDVATPHRTILDGARSHRLDVDSLVIHRSRGVDEDEFWAEYPFHGDEVVGDLRRIACVLGAQRLLGGDSPRAFLG